MLTTAQRKALLQRARHAIAAQLQDEAISDWPDDELADLSDTHRGAFVTLHIDGQLRGCIGNIEGTKPLPELVTEMARAAAFNDPRFQPLRAEELEKLDIEISVLSPLSRVTSPEEIKIGEHGLLIRRGMRQGLLLPQVAIARDWEVTTFLKYVCKKANLPDDAWQDPDSELFCFSAEVFSETTVGAE